jgi:uncharacterized membrane protein
MSAGRLEAFSNGVMAVIITIMVLDLHSPAGPRPQDLGARLPELLVYVLSFVFVGIYWNNHHHLLKVLGAVNGQVMWANLHLLFWISLVPFMTSWMATYYAHAWPAACYGVLAFSCGVAYSVLTYRVIATLPADSELARAIGSDKKGKASLGLYALGVGLAFVSPYLSYACYTAVSVMWFVPDRRVAAVVVQEIESSER